jgi:CRISPR/Cas system-associated protein Csx1
MQIAQRVQWQVVEYQRDGLTVRSSLSLEIMEKLIDVR